MDLFEAIKKRHSYRGNFKNIPIPREDLEKIVEAGIRAPSGCNEQAVEFVIVDDREKLKAIHKIIDYGFLETAQAMIICVLDHRPVFRDISFCIEDCAASTENILLAVTALGYASVWIDGHIRVDGRAKEIARLLSVPDDKEVRVILPLGIPEEPGTQNAKKPFSERAFFNVYKSTNA
ncbi:MAG: nitroreductase family protein [Spirochaetales bacterium]|nr:nitroreductase family protein [Spirochaetales bacterium]